jgi:hypothetical protein
MDQDGDFAGRLLDGERVLWTGRPRAGLILGARDIFLIPFSLLWGGFAVFWEGAAIRSGAPIFFQLWGAPFVVFGLFMIAGRFVIDAWLRNRTRYAVTNRRILIARAEPFGKFISVYLDRLPDAQLSEGTRGRGTIRFGQADALWGSRSFAIWIPALSLTPQFIAIDDARRVYDQIQRTIGRAA